VSEFAKHRVLRLAPGCRLSTGEAREGMLLIPEGAMRLKGPARTILELCDGIRALGEIIEELSDRYPLEDAARIETEALAFLARLRDRGVLEDV
jgi:coenzyme PQQ biosynthesis protein PqqD